MKTCTKCGELKPPASFYKGKRYADGHRGSCKVCICLIEKARRKANPEKHRAAIRKWKKANPEKVRAGKEKWRLAHPENARARERRRRLANPEEARAREKKWRKENRGVCNAKTRKREAAKFRAAPKWADQAAIRAIYSEAVRITKATGIEHHVDHSVPLNHPMVQGLHNEFNLQILTATANVSKGNRRWPNMWQQRAERSHADEVGQLITQGAPCHSA